MRQSRGYSRLVESENVHKEATRRLIEIEQESPQPASSLELRSRGAGGRWTDPTLSNIESTSNTVACLERPLSEGDTLQKIALQYSLPVAELKRLNNLINEQDLYGRSFIRIPVKQYSHVEELIAKGAAGGLRPAGTEETHSEGSDAFLPLSDSEDQHVSGDRGGTRPERSLTCSPTSSVGSPDDNLRQYRKMLRGVDASLEKAKTMTDNLENRSVEEDEAIFNGDIGALWGPRVEPSSKLLEQNLGRYLIGVLVSFAVLGAAGYIVYTIFLSS